MWVVGDMIKHKIDIKKCPVGTIPFGTGNDFARCLGNYKNIFILMKYFIFL